MTPPPRPRCPRSSCTKSGARTSVGWRLSPDTTPCTQIQGVKTKLIQGVKTNLIQGAKTKLIQGVNTKLVQSVKTKLIQGVKTRLIQGVKTKIIQGVNVSRPQAAVTRRQHLSSASGPAPAAAA